MKVKIKMIYEEPCLEMIYFDGTEVITSSIDESGATWPDGWSESGQGWPDDWTGAVH